MRQRPLRLVEEEYFSASEDDTDEYFSASEDLERVSVCIIQ